VSGLPDPTDEKGKWASVKVKPIKKLAHPVTLARIKSEPALAECEIIRQSRLSVAEITPAEWQAILGMSEG
jgi:predicted RNA-binding protein with PUA-like domain